MAAQSSLLSVVVFRGLPVCRQCYGGALGSLGRPSPRGLGRAPRPRKASGLAVQEASGTKHPAASWLRMASWRRCMQTSTTHPHDDDSRKEAVELINKLTTGYWENTFITADRASEEYLLRPEDLGELTTRAVRSAHETTSSSNVVLYLKTDVERRAIEVWGSWPALEAELWRRQTAREEEEKRRQGLSALIAHLKKLHKDQSRMQREAQVYGGKEERVSFLTGSAKVVLLAIVSNFAVLVFKTVAYLYTGSAAMLSEAIHSLADMLNQCLLAVGIAQSIRRPDPDHPYGWSRARYVYSLISGVGIFFLGSGVSCYHGVLGIMHPPVLESLPVAFSVLAASLAVEGATLWAAVKQVRKSAQEAEMTFKSYVLRGRDPAAVTVLLEDSAAITGVLLAASMLGLAQYTGNTLYDAIGSIGIGGLLGFVALFLIQRNSSALVGQSIPREDLREIINLLESDVMIRSIHDVKATDMGMDG
jgi:zinc transporter 9